MTNHRELQRCLFRAQMDTRFAQALHSGDAQARSETELNDAEFALFQQASLAGITADPGQTRRLQMLGNATLEYRLSLAAARDPRSAIEGFTSSAEFHTAIRQDASLALAAGKFLQRCLADQFWPRTLCDLEFALAQARRAQKQGLLSSGVWQVATSTRVLELPAGSLDFAAKLRVAIDQESQLPNVPRRAKNSEAVLCSALPASARWELARVNSEVISPAIAQLFEFLAEPRDEAQLSDFARSLGAEFADLKPILHEYRVEGAVVFGGEL